MDYQILYIVLQICAPILLAIATAVGAVIANAARKYLDAKTAKVLRDALHDSAANGLKYAIAKGVPASAVLQTATDYVKAKNPDAVKKLRVSDNTIKDIVRTKT